MYMYVNVGALLIIQNFTLWTFLKNKIGKVTDSLKKQYCHMFSHNDVCFLRRWVESLIHSEIEMLSPHYVLQQEPEYEKAEYS